MLSELSDASKIIGIKQSYKAIKSGIAIKAFIANDADQKVIKNIVDLCKKEGVPMSFAHSMSELGKACKIDVKAAITVIVK